MSNIKKYSKLLLGLFTAIFLLSSKGAISQESAVPMPNLQTAPAEDKPTVKTDLLEATKKEGEIDASLNQNSYLTEDSSQEPIKPEKNLEPILIENSTDQGSQISNESGLQAAPEKPNEAEQDNLNDNTKESNAENEVKSEPKTPNTKSETEAKKVETTKKDDEESKTNIQKEQPIAEAKNTQEEAPVKKKAPLKSLMFGEQEIIDIELALESYRNGSEFLVEDPKEGKAKKEKKKVETKDSENSLLHLGSILYNSDKIWSIWINNKKITSSDNDPSKELYIKSISRTEIEVLWKMSLSKWKILSKINSDELVPNVNEQNQVEINFTLKPNQTFILKNQKIIEGKMYLQ